MKINNSNKKTLNVQTFLLHVINILTLPNFNTYCFNVTVAQLPVIKAHTRGSFWSTEQLKVFLLTPKR